VIFFLTRISSKELGNCWYCCWSSTH